MQRINRPEISRRLALLDHRCDLAEQRDKVLLRDSLQMRRLAASRPHHLALSDSGIKRMAGDVVEVRAHVGQQLFPGGRSLDNAF